MGRYRTALTFKLVAPDEVRVYRDGDYIGDIFKDEDILNPGRFHYLIWLYEDRRGWKRVTDPRPAPRDRRALGRHPRIPLSHDRQRHRSRPRWGREPARYSRSRCHRLTAALAPAAKPVFRSSARDRPFRLLCAQSCATRFGATRHRRPPLPIFARTDPYVAGSYPPHRMRGSAPTLACSRDRSSIRRTPRLAIREYHCRTAPGARRYRSLPNCRPMKICAVPCAGDPDPAAFQPVLVERRAIPALALNPSRRSPRPSLP